MGPNWAKFKLPPGGLLPVIPGSQTRNIRRQQGRQPPPQTQKPDFLKIAQEMEDEAAEDYTFSSFFQLVVILLLAAALLYFIFYKWAKAQRRLADEESRSPSFYGQFHDVKNSVRFDEDKRRRI